MERSGGARSLGDCATGERSTIDPVGGNSRGMGGQGSRRYSKLAVESRVHYQAKAIHRFGTGKKQTLPCPVFTR